MKITPVIVTYNRLEKLKKAIAAVLAQDFDSIVVVNNNSTDDTKAWLDEQTDSRLKILNLEENTGGAGGFYHGCRYATEELETDWLLLFDDDAYPREDLVEKFRALDLSNYKDLGAISCAVYMPDGVLADFNRPGRNPFNSLTNTFKYLFTKTGTYINYEELEHGNAIPVDFSSFVGFCVKTEVIKAGLGYPLKEFFIYGDDWTYSLELSKLGYKNLYFSDLVFYHDSNTFVQNYDEQLWKKYYAYRNSLFFYKRASGLFFPIVFLAKLFRWFLDVFKYKQKLKYFNTIFRACRDFPKLRYAN